MALVSAEEYWKQHEDSDEKHGEDSSSILHQCDLKGDHSTQGQGQAVHWKNVQKRHREYLANMKVLPNLLHDEANCLICKEPTSIATTADKPVWACTMSDVSRRNGLSFPQAEMTGHGLTKTESTVVTVTHLLVKMKVMKAPAWYIDQGTARELSVTCDFCYRCYKGVRGKRCATCRTKVYCGAECRALDWKVHKFVCRGGEAVGGRTTGKNKDRKGTFGLLYDKFSLL